MLIGIITNHRISRGSFFIIVPNQFIQRSWHFHTEFSRVSLNIIPPRFSHLRSDWVLTFFSVWELPSRPIFVVKSTQDQYYSKTNRSPHNCSFVLWALVYRLLLAEACPKGIVFWLGQFHHSIVKFKGQSWLTYFQMSAPEEHEAEPLLGVAVSYIDDY